MSQYKKFIRITFVDTLADLTGMKVAIYNDNFGMGTILGGLGFVSDFVQNIYRDKAFMLEHNPVGAAFNYAVPNEGFAVKTNNRIIEKIEEIEFEELQNKPVIV